MPKTKDSFLSRMKKAKTALDLKGIFADPSRPYDPKEREKAWAAHSMEVVRKGRRSTKSNGSLIPESADSGEKAN